MDWNKYNPKMLSMFGQAASIFGAFLPEIASQRDDIMVLSADMSTPAGLDKFKSQFPDRFINLGIAEQNMIGVGAGLADEGYTVVSEAQACFITMRSYEPIRQYSGYMGGKQVLVGLSGGFSLTFMGNTHYALEDIALMRTIPGMTVIAPCDAFEAVKSFDAALRHDKPSYIRVFGGPGIPIVHASDFSYEIGKAIKLCEGNEIQIIATGSMVSQSLMAAEKLSESGIEAEVLDMHTIVPLDIDAIRKDVKRIITVEEHREVGGLGDSVANVIASVIGYPKLLKIAVPMSFGNVGNYDYLLEQNGLTANQIFEKISNDLYNYDNNRQSKRDRGCCV